MAVIKKDKIKNYNYDFVVIGGGAAGCFSAINLSSKNNISACIIEVTNKLLNKVKISGGGRCNVTHNCFDVKELIKNYPRGEKELISPFSKFQAKDTIEWFKDRKIKLVTEEDGRIFPETNKSQTIINCFLTEIKQNKVDVFYQTKIESLKKENSSFEICLKQNNEFVQITAKNLILATGSSNSGYKLASDLGHSIVKPIPSLFTFKISDKRLSNLQGTSAQNTILKLKTKDKNIFQNSGAILITHWGLSGPGIIKLSSIAARALYESNYSAELSVNWCGLSPNQALDLIQYAKTTNPKKKIYNFCPFEITLKHWKELLSHINISDKTSYAELKKSETSLIVEEITSTKLNVSGKGIFKEEFVTAGGINLKEVNFKNMESKICKNLFFAGEILDIDGFTGGFNFQAAWTTGYLVAAS